MNKFTTLAVVIVAACTVTYTIVTMIRNHRRYVRQKEALDRWFSASSTSSCFSISALFCLFM